ncbi:SHOCT domain-containing protein [Alicyclobacillus sp. ALC3]|uniref:SHOCT domain-containing protein n=1 Tax=Alicyclobacillus sp. ALC3 TaxID=2796143 RepID=UPI0023795583|nr:SHOCT domain-containing protein [Alicyclobacillus sp. ALC3]WDL98815.1 SHOCT domain-containing protein [Alicyclobacillus sp. ALC3]
MGCCGGGNFRSMGYGYRGHRGYQDEPIERDVRRAQSSTPLDLLKERLAKGEITIDEYQRLSAVLSS